VMAGVVAVGCVAVADMVSLLPEGKIHVNKLSEERSVCVRRGGRFFGWVVEMSVSNSTYG
jgi:hypothetical protein